MRMTKKRAHELTQQARQSLDQFVECATELYEGKAYEVLGYPSWAEYRKVEFPFTVSVTGKERVAITDGWKAKHPKMTDTDMAAALGVSARTLTRDRQPSTTNVVDKRQSKSEEAEQARRREGERRAAELTDHMAELKADRDSLVSADDKLPMLLAARIDHVLSGKDPLSRAMDRLVDDGLDGDLVDAALSQLADRAEHQRKRLGPEFTVDGESWETDTDD